MKNFKIVKIVLKRRSLAVKWMSCGEMYGKVIYDLNKK